jgi:uncharacterized protein
MATKNWDHWGHLAERYQEKRPRRMLALDGGGIRGLMTARMLVRMEEMLSQGRGGSDFRLCHYFDYIGGTSTGAIIAAALARGMSAPELLDFYQDFGRQAFTKRSLFARWKSLYENGELAQKLQEVFGRNTTLEPEHLQSLLLVVTRNTTTDSAWPISSNPAAMFNDPASSNCNLRIPLWQLVRASTAAPVYFPPEVIKIDPDDPEQDFVFVDGGTTPYNNPAFLMYRMATSPAYRLGWDAGEKNLLIVSLGTGSAPKLGTEAEDPEQNLAAAAAHTLSALMNQAQVDQDVNCRTVGRCNHGASLDLEIGDLIPRNADNQPIPLEQDLGRGFLYLRYEAELTRAGLDRMGLNDVDPEQVSKLDSTDGMDDLLRIGEKLSQQLRLEDFGSFV